jgi:RNA polymerase sigma-70 factor (ECF subfamily)
VTEEVDARAHQLAQGGDLAGAASLIIREHGPGVIGWLRALTRSPEEADEVFSIVCERLWKALPQFAWPGSPRTWMYVVGRNALIDVRRRGRVHREIPLSESPPLAEIVRSTTAAYRKTEAKDRLAELRESLDPEERTLLILRVDRGMAWRDIAEVLCGGEADAAEIQKSAARVRKQFERLKGKLRTWFEPT